MSEQQFYVEDDVMARQQIESIKYISLDKAVKIVKNNIGIKRIIKELTKNAKQKSKLP